MIFILDLFFSAKLKKSKKDAHGEYPVWNDLYEGKINADVVVYGSSRACYHFDTKLLEDGLAKSCYNLGIEGHNFWLEYLRHKVLLKYNKKPKYILLSIDIFTFQKRAAIFNHDQLLPFMLYNKDMRKYTKTYNQFSFLIFTYRCYDIMVIKKLFNNQL